MAKPFSQIKFEETDDTRKHMKNRAHSDFIDKFIAKWYDIDDQINNEEKGLNWSIISDTLVTTLTPPQGLPAIKLENKKIFWKYDSYNETFTPFDNPIEKLKAFKKSSDLNNQFDQWIDMYI